MVLLYQSGWRIKKVYLYRTLHYSEVSAKERTGFYYLQKQKDLDFHDLSFGF